MQCPGCQHENPADAAFCQECGARLETDCPSCRTTNRRGAKFCRNSGRRLGPIDTPQAAPRGILVSYETFAHVRDEIHCEERGHIRVKGIAYPVDTYEAVALKTDLVGTWKPVHADMAHLRLELQPDLMSEEERDMAATALRQALHLLERRMPTTGDESRTR